MGSVKANKFDPFEYNGPLLRADGVRPFNHYFWPTESWWAYNSLGHRIDSRWHFGIVALADGRFSVEGSVYSIERNEYGGRPIVYPTRSEAIRVAAARMIKTARRSHSWGFQFGGLKGAVLADVINWARTVVARETGAADPKPVTVKEPPPPKIKTGLPLFDHFL